MIFNKLPHRIALLLVFGLGFLFLLLFSDKLRLGATEAKNLFFSAGNFVSAFAAETQSNLQLQVNEFKLENGLKVLLEERHSVPLISMGVWYRVGSKDDPTGLEGISRLAQELTSRGSKLLTGLQGLKILEEAGGHWTNHTLRDQSCFLTTVPKSSIGEILKLEAARMSIDAFSSEDVRKEKDILQDRVLGLKDNPKQVLDSEVSATVFRSKPYRWPTEGVNDSVQKISPEQVWQHYSRYYVPNNAILVAVGDFETKDLLGQIEKSFGKVPRKDDPPQVNVQEPPQLGERQVKVNRQGSIPYLEVAYRAPHILNDDFFAMLMIDAILNGADGLRFPIVGRPRTPSPDSWLFQGLVGKKLATQISTELIPTQESYLYKVTLTLPDQFQYQPAEEAFSELIENLRNVEFSEEKIKKLRTQILNAEILDQGDCENRAFKLGYLESIASYKLSGELESKINQITGQDLMRVASKYLTDEKRTVGWSIPLEKKSIIRVERLQGAIGLPARAPNSQALGPPETLSEQRRCEEIPFWLPSLVRRGRGGGRESCWTNPLESFLSKGDTRGATPKTILSHFQGGEEIWERGGRKTSSTLPRLASCEHNFGGSGTWQIVSTLLDSVQFWKPLALHANPVLDALPIEQAASPTGSADSADTSWPFKMERRVSKNGATLIVLESGATPTVALCAVIRAGGARDSEGREGTALFVARMLGRGTKSRNAAKILDTVERLQARLDVETGYLASVVTLEGPSRNIPELLQLLSDIVQNAAFTQFEMESERTELLAGLREAETENPQILKRLLREKIYPSGHPFRRPIGGNLTSIERIKLTDLDSFYKKNYRPSLFSLVIAGDIQTSSTLDAAEKLFGTWKVNGAEENISVPELSTAVDSSSEVKTLPEKAICSVGFGVPGIAAKDPDFLPMFLGNQVFGKGRSSRLAQRIRNEDGLTDAVESGFIGQVGEGSLAIQVSIPSQKIDPLVSAVRSEVERFQKDGISQSELESVKKAIINDYWVRLRSNRSLAYEFVFSEINQLGSDYVISYPDLIAGISKDQVLECIRKHLDFDLGPKVIVGSYEKR